MNNIKRKSVSDHDYAIALYRNAFKVGHIGSETLAMEILDELKHLDERERVALKSRFRDNKTFRQVGIDIGASKNRASVIVAKALSKLRNPSILQKLSNMNLGQYRRLTNLYSPRNLNANLYELVMAHGLTADMKLLALLEILQLTVLDLKFTLETKRSLVKAGRRSIYSLLIVPTYNELISIDHISKESCDEIISKMRDIGFTEWAARMETERPVKPKPSSIYTFMIKVEKA